MITLKKITYCVGIGVTISLFTLFMYTALPGLIQNSNWDNFGELPLDEEAMLEKFQEHPSYAAFYERFPDAKEELDYSKKSGRSSLEVGIRNFETGVELKLHLNYNKYEDNVNANVNCNVQNINVRDFNGSNLYANGLFVVDFIEQTDCLELENNTIDIQSNPPKIIYGPNGSTTIELER